MEHIRPGQNRRTKMRSAFIGLLCLFLAGSAILTLSACGTKKTVSAQEVAIDLGRSSLYTEKERNDAVLLIREKFAGFAGDCELHSVRYAGDEANNEENLEWLNSLREARSNIPPQDAGKKYVQVAEFLSDFHSPVEEGPYAREIDTDYKDYPWWLARLKDGDWEIVSWGY
jgi:D-alanyl-D-alanine carboxypeptidase